MFRNRNRITWILFTVIPLIAATSCNDERDKTTQVAREAADRQAQQNTEMAQVSKEVAAGSHQLVEADAKARQEIVGVHRDLQAERSRLDSGWSELQKNRKELVAQLRTESALVAVSRATGYLFLVVAVLSFCWYVLFRVRHDDGTDARLNELLVSEILPNHSSMVTATEKTKLEQLDEPEPE